MLLADDCTSRLGDADRVLGNATHPYTAHYRGQRMLNASLKQIAKDLLKPSSKVVVAGTDGGANVLYIQADRIGSVLHDAAGLDLSTGYAVVPVEGFWIHWDGYYQGYSLQQSIVGRQDAYGDGAPPIHEVAGGNTWEFMTMAGAVHPACVDAFGVTNTSNHWRCLLAEHAGKYINSRIFPLEQLWGVFGSYCLVNAEFVNGINNGARLGMALHCDKRGTARKSMHACVEYGWYCSTTQLNALVIPYQRAVRDRFSDIPFLNKPGNGAFMHSCHVGNEGEDDADAAFGAAPGAVLVLIRLLVPTSLLQTCPAFSTTRSGCSRATTWRNKH